MIEYRFEIKTDRYGGLVLRISRRISRRMGEQRQNVMRAMPITVLGHPGIIRAVFDDMYVALVKEIEKGNVQCTDG